MKVAAKYLLIFMLMIQIETASAVEIEKKGKALSTVLGSTKVSQTKVNIDGKDIPVFYTKGSDGKAERLAFVQEGLYPPNCSHTWVVGVEKGKVTQVRVVEMECPHAFPTKEVSFLSQFEGKAIKDGANLDKDIKNIAKATGSCKLAIDAVKRSLKGAEKLAGQI